MQITYECIENKDWFEKRVFDRKIIGNELHINVSLKEPIIPRIVMYEDLVYNITYIDKPDFIIDSYKMIFRLDNINTNIPASLKKLLLTDTLHPNAECIIKRPLPVAEFCLPENMVATNINDGSSINEILINQIEHDLLPKFYLDKPKWHMFKYQIKTVPELPYDVLREK